MHLTLSSLLERKSTSIQFLQNRGSALPNQIVVTAQHQWDLQWWAQQSLLRIWPLITLHWLRAASTCQLRSADEQHLVHTTPHKNTDAKGSLLSSLIPSIQKNRCWQNSSATSFALKKKRLLCLLCFLIALCFKFLLPDFRFVALHLL